MVEPSYDVIKMAALFYFIENLHCLIFFKQCQYLKQRHIMFRGLSVSVNAILKYAGDMQ